MNQRLCSIDGCGRPHNAKGLCQTHGTRLRVSGSVRAGEPVMPRRTTCEVPGCDRKHACCGYCNMHYLRFRTTGTVDLLPPEWPSGPDAAAWKGDDVGYPAAHHRIVRLRGSASLHLCWNCGSQAVDWAYVYGDADELICEQTGRRYSGKASFYVPLCRSCHKRFDNAARRGDFTFASHLRWLIEASEPGSNGGA